MTLCKRKTRAYLGLDLGGTGAKAGVVDATGRMLGFARRGYNPRRSEAGHAEIPIEEIYKAARDAVRVAVAESGANIRALSISSQGQTFVSLDANRRPVHPAILWYDSRATAQAERLQAAIRASRGRGPRPEATAIASAPKIMWLREHQAARMRRAKCHRLLPDYFSERLCGVAALDPINGSSSGLYADGAPDYDAAALNAAGISREQMGEIRAAGSPIGRVLPEVAGEWSLDAEALVVTGTNDQYTGALGAGNCRPGICSVACGTCLALLALTRRLSPLRPRALLAGRFPVGGYRYGLAYSKTAGVVVDWFRREFCPGTSLAEMDKAAGDVPAGSRGLIALTDFDGTVTPVRDASARGAFFGLTLGHWRADMFRAVIESLGCVFRANLEFLRRCGFRIATVRAIGGGAGSDLWLQTMADVSGVAVNRPAVTEAAVLGAAVLAGAGAGDFGSVAECSTVFYRDARSFDPDPSRRGVYRELYRRHVDLSRRLGGT